MSKQAPLTEAEIKKCAAELNIVLGLKPPISDVLDVESTLETICQVVALKFIEPTDVFTAETDSILKFIESLEPEGKKPEIDLSGVKQLDIDEVYEKLKKSMKLREVKDMVLSCPQFKDLRNSLDEENNTEVLRDQMFAIIAKIKMEDVPEAPDSIRKKKSAKSEDYSHQPEKVDSKPPDMTATFEKIEELMEQQDDAIEENGDLPDELSQKNDPPFDADVLTLDINPAFASACPALSEAEFLSLERLILNDERIIHPILIWNGFIVDGHNRYNIAHKHNIPFAVEEMEFESEDDVILWIKENAVGQRNLPVYAKWEMVRDIEDILKKFAKKGRKPKVNVDIDELLLSEISADEEKYNTRKELAKRAGISEGQVAKVKVIDKRADEKTKQALREGKTTVNAAHKKVTEKVAEDPIKSAHKELEKWARKYSEIEELEPYVSEIIAFSEKLYQDLLSVK